MAKPLRQGDVVLVPFPFADLTGRKVRPAVIVSADPQGAELILAFITSVLTNRSPRGAEVELLLPDSEFRDTGLKADSLIRLGQARHAVPRHHLAAPEPSARPRRRKITSALRTALGL